MMKRKFAILTDIHGDLLALKKIISDARTKNVDDIICLGDVIDLESNSKKCIDLLIENNIKMTLGKTEFDFLKQMNKSSYSAKNDLEKKEIDFIKQLPLYYDINVSYSNENFNKKIRLSHYLINENNKDDTFESNNLKNDINLWIKYNNPKIMYIIGYFHKNFNYNIVDGIFGDYILEIDELPNIVIVESGGLCPNNKASYTMLEIGKSIKLTKIVLNYDTI